MSNYMSYDGLFNPYLQVLCNFSTIREPESYEDAIQHPEWIEAMNKELQALADNKT